jgi:hypothetical protein
MRLYKERHEGQALFGIMSVIGGYWQTVLPQCGKRRLPFAPLACSSITSIGG